MRVGFGFDAHRFGNQWPVRLGGVLVDESRMVEATSDGDVACHAVVDALLGAAGLGDLGSYYPSSDPQWQGISSLELVKDAVQKLAEVGWVPKQVDLTVVAQSVQVAPHRDAIRYGLAGALDIELADVSVKATTTDFMGSIGRDEGLAAMAVAVIAAS
ncbi:MAG: 2-C-methyl-D-erythritol 2,4-cyclodiphosphate synthase [Acidimicrobiia bacterium]|nr:2-C-methyl-D-erythritol 2,4-cyclodiphosphate synthase [Acidimicrobiia bacterium]